MGKIRAVGLGEEEEMRKYLNEVRGNDRKQREKK